MDSGRDSRSLGQRQRTVTPLSSSRSQSVIIFSRGFSCPQGSVIRASWLLHMQWVTLQERNPELREPRSLIITSGKSTQPLFCVKTFLPVFENKVPSALEGGTVSAFYICLPGFMKKDLEHNAVSASAPRTCRNTKGPWGTVFAWCVSIAS